MHILSTIGLILCLIGLATIVTAVGTYIEDRFDGFFVRMLAMVALIVATLSVCYGLAVLISLE